MPDAGEVHVDVLPDLKKFGPKLKAELKKHAARGLDVPLGLDTDKADTELAALRARVSGTSASIRVSADTRAALAKLVGVEKAVQRLDGQTATVTIRTRQQGGVPNAPARQARPAGGGGGGFGGGNQRPFTDVSPAASAAIATIGPAAVPAIGALTGAVAGLTSGLGAATTAAGAFAAGAVPAILDVANVLELQKIAAAGGEEEMAAYEQALADLTPVALETVDSWEELTAAYREWQRGLQGDTLPVVNRGLGVLQSQLPTLTPIVEGSARGFDSLLDSSQAALAGPHWQRFVDFSARQAEPSIGILGRSVGNLAVGFTGLLVSFEPLWNTMGPGMEDLTSKFAAWANEGDNFTEFIGWTIQNGPVFMGTFTSIAGAAIDVGVALAPLGTVYAQGLGILAQAISAVAEQAPWLIQVAVAAKTAHVAFQLLGRVNTGLIQPMSQLPGRVREYTSSLSGVSTATGSAATATTGLRGAVSGLTGALGGPWGIALTAATAALGYWIAKQHEAEQAAKAYADAIREDSGALGENTRELLAQELAQSGVIANARELGISVQDVTDALMGEKEAQQRVNEQLDQYSGVGGGKSGPAANATKARQADLARQLKEALDAESSALAEGTQKAKDAEAAASALSTQNSSLSTSTATVAAQTRDLKTALDQLTGSNISATQAELGYKQALDRATQSVQQNGASTDLNTQAGQRNRQTLVDLSLSAHNYTSELQENNESTRKTIQAARDQRKEFIKVAKQMGYTASEAEDLADEYLGIPKDVQTAIEVNARGTWTGIEGYQEKTRGRGTGYLGGLATGGPVSGPGTGTSDSIVARLSDGEFVEPAATVDYYGPGVMEALRTRSIPREAFAGMPGYAKGGYVRRTRNSSKTSPWQALADHTGTIKPEYKRLVDALVSRVGDQMAKDFKEHVGQGPGAVVNLARASVGKYPESNGNNVNAITRWFGMNGAPWCAMFISWLFAKTGNSRALGRASRTAWTGDYYTSGMRRVSSPRPGDVAVYGTRHVNLVAGGGRRIGGNESNNVSISNRSGGAVFRPMWGRARGFAEGGRVDVRRILAQDRAEDDRFGPSPEVTALRQLAGLASGGLADGWTVVGEDGPELARFDDPARIYSSTESARVLAEARRASTAGSDGASAGPLVGEYHQHLHDSQATVREAMGELTHTLRTVRRGGLYGP